MNYSMETLLRCSVFLLLSCQIQGSTAVTPVFVKKGNDGLLHVMKADVPEKFIILSWNFNRYPIVTFIAGQEPQISEHYSGRVDLSVGNYSVKLKNLQETDSGVYTSQVTGATEVKRIAAFNVTVQGPVSAVVLEVDSVSKSSDSCNLTVTCSTQDSDISSTFTCDTQTCHQEGGDGSKVTTSGSSLRVYLWNDSISCNHSNQVSWTKDMMKIHQFCPQHAERKASHTNVAVVVVVLVILFIVIVGAALYRQQKRKRKMKIPEIETPDQCPVSNDSSHSPTSTYCLVGPHTGPKGSTKTRDTDLPETLYAQVQKPARS